MDSVRIPALPVMNRCPARTDSQTVRRETAEARAAASAIETEEALVFVHLAFRIHFLSSVLASVVHGYEAGVHRACILAAHGRFTRLTVGRALPASDEECDRLKGIGGGRLLPDRERPTPSAMSNQIRAPANRVSCTFLTPRFRNLRPPCAREYGEPRIARELRIRVRQTTEQEQRFADRFDSPGMHATRTETRRHVKRTIHVNPAARELRARTPAPPGRFAPVARRDNHRSENRRDGRAAGGSIRVPPNPRAWSPTAPV